MWITNEKDHTVSVIDTKTQELKASYNVGLRPRGIIFAKDFSELYVCASDDDRIDVLDPETGVVIRSMPSGEDPEQFALHPNNRYLYIANEEDAMATVLDVTSGLVGSEESDLGFPLHPECAIQTDADWYFLHGIFG